MKTPFALIVALLALAAAAPAAHAIENTVSAEASFVNNGAPTGGDAAYLGAGLRYGRTVGSALLFRRLSVVDELDLEGGAYFSRVQGLFAPADSHDIVTTKVDVRYGIQLGQIFQPFVYGGLMKSFGPSPLDELRPALGGGLLISVGHRWSLRADAGIDAIGGGAAYHF